MTELEKFYELKEKVLLEYKKYHPFFEGNWKLFSSRDIQNLIVLIEEKCRQSISEKWIYTHLKPEVNTKIPRKDMLNILAQFIGFSGWDEFSFEQKELVSNEVKTPFNSRKYVYSAIGFLCIGLVIGIYYFKNKSKKETQLFEIKDQFTNEKIQSKELKVYQIVDSASKALEVVNSKVKVANSDNKDAKIVIVSPFYKSKTVLLHNDKEKDRPTGTSTVIELKPDDHAMMLKAFMVSDIKDWQTRKLQLDKILSENLEVIVMLKDNLGAEYFNKKEFSEQLIVPTNTIKRMKIIELKNDKYQKIQFIRIKQE